MGRFIVTAKVDVEVEADDEVNAVMEACLTLDSEACITMGEIVGVSLEDE